MLPALCLALSGCIYSHTIEPLMTDFNATPVGSERSSGGIKTVAFYVSVEWDENGNVRAESIHQFGASTSVESSMHYDDQAELFSKEIMKPIRP